MRAGIVERPEDYRWSSLGYHAQTGNRGGFLSLDLGLRAFSNQDDAARFLAYRKFVYQVGSISSDKGARITEAVLQSEERKNFELGTLDRFRNGTRYFTGSGVIGSKEFVSTCYRRFEHHFTCRHEKKPQRIGGLDGVYSLKRLRAAP